MEDAGRSGAEARGGLPRVRQMTACVILIDFNDSVGFKPSQKCSERRKQMCFLQELLLLESRGTAVGKKTDFCK